jgi:hypothetical protein
MVAEKYRISIDFNLCKNQECNDIIKSILEIAISKLLMNLPSKMIKDIQLSGSLANGEGTVIKTQSGIIIASDIDIVVYLSFPGFIIATIKGFFGKLSHEVNSYLSSKGIKAHVCFTGTTRNTLLLSYLGKSHVYDYEFITNKSLLNKGGTRRKREIYMPTKKDALELTFTIIAEYLLLDLITSSDIEKIYLLAKRVLTLIYSMSIFEGKPKISYEQRINTFKKTFFSTREIELARKFTDFKLDGQISHIFDAFKSKDTKQIIRLNKKLLADMITRVLYYQLEGLYWIKGSRKQELINSQQSSYKTKNSLELMDAYFNKTRKSYLRNVLYTYMLAFISLITGRRLIARLVGPLFMLRHSLKDVANYLVGLIFLFLVESQKNKCIPTRVNSIVDKLGIQLNALKEIWDQANLIKYLP